jgi:hypothetical protein
MPCTRCRMWRCGEWGCWCGWLMGWVGLLLVGGTDLFSMDGFHILLLSFVVRCLLVGVCCCFFDHRCGGCGSKVGAHVLSRVMKRLQSGGNIPSRKEVIIGLDAPDDAAVVEGVGREFATVRVEGGRIRCCCW